MLKICLLFILFSFSVSFGKSISISPEVQKKLGIKTLKVEFITATESKVYPATVLDNPMLSFDVSSPVDGIIEKVFVKQGDVVKKGSILLKVYSPQIANIQSSIQMAKVKLKTAQDTLEREEMLYREEVIPYSRFYGAKIEYERAKGELDALYKALNSYGEVDGNSILIRSKVDGFVAESKAINGMPITLGESVMRVHSHRLLWVEAMVPFDEIKYIKVGGKGYIINPEGKKVEGIITLINHEIDPKTSKNMVRLEVKSPQNILKPNMFVNVEIPLAKREGLLLPKHAVVIMGGKSFVFVKEKDRVSLREVRINTAGDKVEITSGLKEGEEVITQGVIFLKAQFFGSGE